MKVFSGEGNDGFTRTMRPGRLSKADLLIEVIGEIDETSAFLTWSFSQLKHTDLKPYLSHILDDLTFMMAVLAGSDKEIFSTDRIQWLDDEIGKLAMSKQDVKGFILEWKHLGSIALNVSRTVIRRTERTLVRLAKVSEVPSELLVYFNRLSTLIFLFQLTVESDLTPLDNNH